MGAQDALTVKERTTMKYVLAALFLLLVAPLLTLAERTFSRKTNRIVRLFTLILTFLFGMMVFE